MCCLAVVLWLFNNFVVDSAVPHSCLASPWIDVGARLACSHISHTRLVPQVAYFGVVTSSGSLLLINQAVYTVHFAVYRAHYWYRFYNKTNISYFASALIELSWSLCDGPHLSINLKLLSLCMLQQMLFHTEIIPCQIITEKNNFQPDLHSVEVDELVDSIKNSRRYR
jgi:hypothetical protein